MGGSGAALTVLLAPVGFASWAVAKQVIWLRANNVAEDMVQAVQEGFPFPETAAEQEQEQ